MGKGQTCPASLDTFEQASENYLLDLGIFRLVDLGSMIEDTTSTTENLSARLGIDEAIQGDQQTAIRFRAWNRILQLRSHPGP